MDDYGYAWEKLYKAVLSLVGPQPQRERMEAAIVNNLLLLQDPDVPENLLHDFKDLMDKVSSVQGRPGEGSVAATLASMDDLTVDNCAERIVDLYDSVCRMQESY